MNKTIMAIDDSQSMLRFIRFTLEVEGYDVLHATDGQQAMEILEGRDGDPVDLVITDLYMPRLDGLQVIEKLRRWDAYRCVPVIMLTTESHPMRKQAAKEAGASGWIVKPFEPQQLLAVIRRFVG